MQLPVLVGICERHGFKLIERDPLLGYGDDPVEPQSVEQAESLAAFAEDMEDHHSRRCIANFHGTLFDTQTNLSILLDLDKRVVVMSVPEDVLWRFEASAENADISRLIAFSNICNEIAAEISAVLGFMGTEELHPVDMIANDAENHGVTRVDDSFFSDTRLRELFGWYTDFYVNRWKD